MYCVCVVASEFRVVGVRMADTVWTDALHYRAIFSPVLREGSHRVFQTIMDGAPLTDAVVGLVHVSQHDIGVFNPRETLLSAVSTRVIDDREVIADNVIGDPALRRARKATSRPPVSGCAELAGLGTQFTNRGALCLVLTDDSVERTDVVLVPLVMRSSAGVVIVEFWCL